MRRRLVIGALAISVAATALLGIPLAVLARHQIFDVERSRLRDQAAGVATAVEDRLDARRPFNAGNIAYLAPGASIDVLAPDGRIIAHTGPAATGSRLAQSRPINGYNVRISVPAEATRDRADRAALLVAGIGAVAVAAAMVLALWQARRITRPVRLLAADARALGQGQFGQTPHRSGLPELDAIADALHTSASRLDRLLTVQREFAADAAHQLRTPLTGIGLRLEEMRRIGDPDVAAEADDAIEQVDRLNAVISALLDRARDDAGVAARIDLTALLESDLPLWRRVLARQRRTIDVRARPDSFVVVRREYLRAILNALIENAIVHGEGCVHITVVRRPKEVVLTVSDEGPGIAPELADRVFGRHVTNSRSTGIGLALAKSLAEAEGGRLILVDPDNAEFELCLAEMVA